jgi:hypothetical protein
MARKKIREYDSKRLLREHLKRLAGLDLPLQAVQVRQWGIAPNPCRGRRHRPGAWRGAPCAPAPDRGAARLGAAPAPGRPRCPRGGGEAALAARRSVAGGDTPTTPIPLPQVNQSTDWVALLAANPWLSTTKLVVKPDMLFGKRGKNGTEESGEGSRTDNPPVSRALSHPSRPPQTSSASTWTPRLPRPSLTPAWGAPSASTA